tara:strand:+ start:1345 stop:2433 length:1089 start_codon:yes stop_codon:yes gene_type:complete
MKHNLAKNVSIIITTYNRNNFIKLYLNFLDQNNFGGEIIIGNASERNEYEELNVYINELNYEFSIKNIHFPKKENNMSFSMNDCFIGGIKEAKRDYFILCCDDDLIIPKMLDYCEKILDSNNQINGVTGDHCWINRNYIEPPNQTRSILNKDPIERIQNFINKPYHSLFTLVRRSNVKKIAPKNYRDINFNHFAADWSWILSIIIKGRIKKINKPFLIKQFHGENLHLKNKNHPFISYSEFKTKDYYQDDVKSFTDFIEEQIVETYAESNKIIPHEYVKEIQKFFTKYENFRLNKNNENLLKIYINRFFYYLNKILKTKFTFTSVYQNIFGYKSIINIRKMSLYNEKKLEIEKLQKKFDIFV